MGHAEERDKTVQKFLRAKKIASLEELKTTLATDVRMTVFRSLRRLGYLSSYSHRGQFYTLSQIPDFDELGLWSFGSVRFSRFGNLLATAKVLVEEAAAGYTAAELDYVLDVEVRHTLLQLTREGKISRCKIARSHVYMSAENGRRRQQRLTREDRQAHAEIGLSLEVEVLPDEVRAAIILFFSTLDEKQRRLLCGAGGGEVGAWRQSEDGRAPGTRRSYRNKRA